MNERTAEMDPQVAQPEPDASHRGHTLMMLGCGIMFATVLVLVANGAISATALTAVLGCVAMMGVMMVIMSRSMGRHRGDLG